VRWKFVHDGGVLLRRDSASDQLPDRDDLLEQRLVGCSALVRHCQPPLSPRSALGLCRGANAAE
jgi:hypothetical protein